MRAPLRVLITLLVGAALLGAVALAPLPTAPPAEQATAASSNRDACGPILVKRDGTRWRCSFVDNFNGPSLNRSKWRVGHSRSVFTTGLTCYVDSRDNIKVRRGGLRLTTRRGPSRLCGGVNQAFVTRFTGGLITSKGNFSQTYGRFEVRAKFPATAKSGHHGGFWMFPAEPTYGQWPASGELDVAEWWSSNPQKALPSLHFNGRNGQVDTGWDCRVRHYQRYHTYRVIWRPRIMRFYIDGRQCFARRWTPDLPQRRPQPFDHPFSMILNMGVTKHTGRKKLTPQTEFPATFVVDYAKAWR